MAGRECLPLKMKRKDIDRLDGDSSDFSLCSPAIKIRRLDLCFAPKMEEEDAEMGMMKPVAEELNPESVKDERAVVVFKPLQAQQSYFGNLYADTYLISGFENKFLCAGVYGDARLTYDKNPSSNNCRAVVPWSPSQFSTTQSEEPFREPHAPVIIQLDETGEDAMMEEAPMEIDEDGKSSMPLPQEPQFTPPQFTPRYGTARENEGLHRWKQQQQCMIPQLPQTNSTPISWSQ